MMQAKVSGANLFATSFTLPKLDLALQNRRSSSQNKDEDMR